MSRHYRIEVTIVGFNNDRKYDIQSEAEDVWPFDDWTNRDEDFNPRLRSTAECNLCGGETEEEFADRLTKAIFKGNRGPCEVSIEATCLEELPFNVHKRTPKDWERLKPAPEEDEG